MAKLLANLLFEPKGKHDPTQAYTIKDTVMSADGSQVYFALQDVPVGVELTDTDYWKLQIDLSTTKADMESATAAANAAAETANTAAANVREDVDRLTEEIDKIAPVNIGKNMYNPATSVSGILNESGGVSVNEAYTTSDFIQIESGSTYFFSVFKHDADGGTVRSSRYLALQFDANKTPIAGTFRNETPVQGLLIETGATAKYIRVSTANPSNAYRTQVEAGSSAGEYEDYSETQELLIPLGEEPANQARTIADERINRYIEEKRFPVKKSPQLFDRATVTDGYTSVDGSTHKNENYVYTKPIDVSENAGRTIYFSINGVAKGFRYITAYASNGVAMAEAGISNDTLSATTYTVPEGVAYIVISYYSTSFKPEYSAFQAEYDEITPYSEYGEYFDVGATSGVDILYGKTWAVCGDSFTDGSNSGHLENGKYAGFTKTYPYFIGNRTGIEILDYFDGGKTLAYPADGTFVNSLTCPTANKYYQNIPEDVDYITIYLGINDSHHENGTSGTDGEDVTGIIPLGTIDDADTSTYYGAWNVVLSWLIENRPFAHIGIIVSNGCDRVEYRTAQLEIAKKYGIPYIDLNGDGRTPVMIRSQNPDIASVVKTAVNKKQAVDYDGTVTGSVNWHPNDAAHEYESYFIENFLRSI